MTGRHYARGPEQLLIAAGLEAIAPVGAAFTGSRFLRSQPGPTEAVDYFLDLEPLQMETRLRQDRSDLVSVDRAAEAPGPGVQFVANIIRQGAVVEQIADHQPAARREHPVDFP